MHALLHSVPPTLQQSESEVTQSCPTLCDPMDSSLPGSFIHGSSQARVLEWAAISFSRGSFNPGMKPKSPASQADALQTDKGSLLSHQGRLSIVWPQVNNREGTQPHPSTENWIKDLLSMAPPIRTRPSFPLSQSLPLGSFHKSLILLHQKADRLKTTITGN